MRRSPGHWGSTVRLNMAESRRQLARNHLKQMWFGLAAVCAAFCVYAEDITASVPVVVNGKIQATLETQVYGLEYEGHRPIVILSHGSSGGHPEQSIDWSAEANYFTQKGYVVLGFMRRGRGKSTGTSLES